MRDHLKFSWFRLSIEPISPKSEEGTKAHLISPTDVALGQQRKANLKGALFCSVIAILLILANNSGHSRNEFDPPSLAASPAGVSLIGYPQHSREKRIGSVVRIRLSNTGNHPVFYPAVEVPLLQLDKLSLERLRRLRG
jgi:hypothetical protein